MRTISTERVGRKTSDLIDEDKGKAAGGVEKGLIFKTFYRAL